MQKLRRHPAVFSIVLATALGAAAPVTAAAAPADSPPGTTQATDQEGGWVPEGGEGEAGGEQSGSVRHGSSIGSGATSTEPEEPAPPAPGAAEVEPQPQPGFEEPVISPVAEPEAVAEHAPTAATRAAVGGATKLTRAERTAGDDSDSVVLSPAAVRIEAPQSASDAVPPLLAVLAALALLTGGWYLVGRRRQHAR